MAVAFFLGVDVSKSSLAVVLIDHKEKTLWSNKNIANTTAGFEKLTQEALKHASKKCGQEDFTIFLGMESTGVYGEQLAYFMHDKNPSKRFVVYVLNPMAVHSYAKASLELNKNDSTDARIIASYLSIAIAKEQVEPWSAPSEEERILRALSRRRGELIHQLTSEKNRLEKLANMNKPTGGVLKSVKEHIEYLQNAIEALDKEIAGHISLHPILQGNNDLLQSIPGIGEVTSTAIQGEAGDLSQFSTVKQFISFIGLAPVEYSSGSSVKKHSRISKRGNSRIRQYLYMSAMVAIRVNPVIRDFYNRLVSRGKCKKVALIASMRKLSHLIWGVLKTQTEFDPNYVSPSR